MKNEIKIDYQKMRELSKQVTLSVTLKTSRLYPILIKIGLLFVKFGVWIIGCKIKIENI
jgi:hypothetical protein